ncbi:MAG: type III-B CRISPR module RAMP protein Cmr1 [Saprospiraceae bacterium]|nr:type III-B CRISPR module RAMP protein Cmr1 [Saprospiraceae bacterium]MDW8485088.1 type III-B CRISPR module RAMP protein Cmr1 [Saprospiraceae bacterium]
MPHITFHCRTISPMFIGGADPDKAELRPPSLKGALRFWERAIARHWIFEEQRELPQKLLRHDEELMGGAFTVQKKSEVSIEIHHEPVTSSKNWLINGNALRSKREGLKYLLFTLIVHNKEKEGIAPDFPFQVTFRCKEGHENALEKNIAAFWTLTYFGALGTRARRGAGAFEVVGHEGFDLPAGISFSPDKAFVDLLREGLGAAQRIFDVPEAAEHPRGYSTIGKQIWVSKSKFDTWENALQEIGGLMLRIRQPRRPDPKVSSEKPRFTQKTLHQKAAFGLPVSVRNERDNVVNFAPVREGSNLPLYDRRASPLWITLAKCTRRTHWIVSKLEGDFMEQESSLSFKDSKGRSFSWPKQDDSVLDEFLKIVGDNAYLVFKR